MRLLIYISFFIPTFCMGQITFFNSYGGEGNDYGKSVISTMDTAYTIIGATESFGNGNTDMYLFKIDSSGNLLWSKTYGGSNIDWGIDLKQTQDTGYILCGYSNSDSWDYDVFIVKTDKNGDSLWTKTFGGSDWDFGYSIETTKDSGYIIAGETYSFGSGLSDGYAIKLDSLGDTLWTKTFGNTGKDLFNVVIETKDGDFLFGGSTTTTDGDTDHWLVKTDNAGNELWQYTAGDSLNEVINDVVELIDSNYIFVGNKESILGMNLDMEYQKTSKNGAFIYSKLFDSSIDETGKFVLRYQSETHYIVGGSSNSFGNGGHDIVNIKVEQTGFGILFTSDGSIEDDIVEQADTTTDNSIIIVGTTDQTVNGIKSVFVMKTDTLLDSSNPLNELFDISNTQTNYLSDVLSIYPNPTTNNITVNGIPNLLNKPYKIFNLLGEVVLNGTFNTNQINTENLTKGIYFISIPSIITTPARFTKI